LASEDEVISTQTALERGLSDAFAKKNVKYFFFSLVIAFVLIIPPIYGLSLLVEVLLTDLNLGEGWLRWLALFVANIIFVTLGYFLIVPLMFIVMSAFSGFVAENIRKERYPDISFGQAVSVSEAILETIFIVLKFVLYFLIASPALLVFGAGYIIFFAIGFVLFRKLLLLDVLGAHLPLNQVKADSATFEGGKYMVTSICLYVVSFIPVLNLFVPYLSICILLNQSMADELEALEAR
jgi:uncharacterized protein involved in cysteine biosynthesis